MNRSSTKYLQLFYEHQSIFLILLIVTSIPLIFHSTTSSMLTVWINDSSYNHGFLIFPISIWLILLKRNQISNTEAGLEFRTIVLLLPVLLLWCIAYVVSINVVQQLSMISLILITVWMLLGTKIFYSIIFPLGFLFLSVPLGKSLIPLLMQITADITVSLIKLVGIPVYTDGLYFNLPSGNWSVVEACSGLNYLIASITLGVLFAYLTYQSLTKRLIFVVFIALFSVIANGLRAFGIVMIGHFSDMKYGTGGDHTFYGWVFFGIVIFSIFYIGNLWRDTLPETKINNPVTHRKSNRFIQRLSLASVVFIAMILTQNLAQHKSSPKESYVSNIEMPENFDYWQFSDDRSLYWRPKITGAELEDSIGFVYGNELVQLNYGYYPTQAQYAEAVSSQNGLAHKINNTTWKKVRSTDYQANTSYVRETELLGGNSRILTWQWYILGNNQTPDPMIAKLLSAVNVIIHNRNDASFVTISTPVLDSLDESRLTLLDFHTKAYEKINHILSNPTGDITSSKNNSD